MNSSDYIPQRMGLTYAPPQIIIEYLVPSTQRLFHHKIKLTRLREHSNVKEMVAYVQKRHYMWMHGRVTDDQVETLIVRLQQGMRPEPNIKMEIYPRQVQLTTIKPTTTTTTTTKPAPAPAPTKPQVNPMKLSNQSFTSSRSKSKLEEMGFQEIDDISQGDDDYGDDYQEDFEEESVTSHYDYNQLNLNAMTPEEVAKHKKKMDVMFNQNIKKPSDPDYQYDKRVNFEAVRASEWDEDD